MRKIYTFITAALLLIAVKQVQAQSSGGSFAVQRDSVSFATAGNFSALNGVNNLTSSSITIQWKVIATNFPPDWLAGLGICDNINCYNNTALWPLADSPFSAVYGVGMGDFHMNLDLTSATSHGTYYLKVKLNNLAVASDSLVETYIVTRFPTAVPIVRPEGDISLYPNPAVSDINVVYDAGSDVKTIAIYNIIGKVMNVYKPTVNTGARLNLDNLSSGVYFVRLMNSHGDIVTTRKFTKQ